MTKTIVLTGGPCAGKTMALNRVLEHFKEKGYKVFTIPEVPTIFTAAGMDYLTSNRDLFYVGEKATMQTQLLLEDSFMAMADAVSDKPTLLICDRGTMDISTYMPQDLWERMEQELGIDNTMLLKRYDAVLHLTTAAKGMERYYNTNTNAQRLEKADEEGMKQARQLDDKALEVWKMHPVHCVIPNVENFDEKLQMVVDRIEELIVNS